MTTIAVDLRAMVIAADTQNTDSSGTKYRCCKIEGWKDGRLFIGSGHLLSIGKAKRWAALKFAEKHRPDFEEHFGERPGDFAFSCVLIEPNGRVTLIDDEMEPQPIRDEYFAIGSGGHFAVGAMDAGATAEEAVRIACKRDPNTSEPIHVFPIPPFRPKKK
jgi:hypothetical protein